MAGGWQAREVKEAENRHTAARDAEIGVKNALGGNKRELAEVERDLVSGKEMQAFIQMGFGSGLSAPRSIFLLVLPLVVYDGCRAGRM